MGTAGVSRCEATPTWNPICGNNSGVWDEEPADFVSLTMPIGPNCRVDSQIIESKDQSRQLFESGDISRALSERIGKIEFLERRFSKAGPVGAMTPKAVFGQNPRLSREKSHRNTPIGHLIGIAEPVGLGYTELASF